MREIKFRVWDKLNKQFLPYYMEESIRLTDINFWTLNKNYILIQYIWLKDKNWKEIYEWDIVRTTTKKYLSWEIVDIYWIIKYKASRHNAWFDIEIYKWKIENWSPWFANCEIIWNFYENENLINNK
jgi:uncharacterized phage protein (TIGR01671 family)